MTSLVDGCQLLPERLAYHSSGMKRVLEVLVAPCSRVQLIQTLKSKLQFVKSFDRVNHKTLFSILEKRNLPPTLLRFIWSWYKEQSCTVKWNSCSSLPFGVSNGVRQGGVLSPILFTVYLDELLQHLAQLDTGCHLGHHFVGSVYVMLMTLRSWHRPLLR